MAHIGVLVETEAGAVKDTNFGVVTASLAGGANTVSAIVVDGEAASAAATLEKYGVEKIVPLSAAGGDPSASPDFLTAALAEAIGQLSLDGLLGLASARGRDVFARLAATMDLPLVSDCVGIDFDSKTVQKSHFSGKSVATVQLKADVLLCTVRPNAIDGVEAATTAQVAPLSVDVGAAGKVTVVDVSKETSGKIDLTEANVIITGGRPIAAPENYKMLEDCAQLLGAAVGASRAAVDAGYAPHAMQVGQTGKTVSPSLYIGCGLSGSVQHFAGMKTSKVIVAINTDKDAPIFQKCDYGIIGDMFEVVPILTKILKEQLCA
jgi:electron transfer flavoprotein alpha subunit